MEFRSVHALSFVVALVVAVCPAFGQVEKAAFVEVYDDGEVDVWYSAGDTTGTYEIVMLFENVGGTDVTLDGLDICMRQDGGDPLMRYEVVGYLPDGPGGDPGTELFTVAATAEGIGAVSDFDSTDLGISLDGVTDLYLGLRHNPVVDPAYIFCADRDGLDGTVHPSFSRFNESGAWLARSDFDPDYNAMMFRAFLSTPGVVGEQLLVPSFAVDTTSGMGTTTLFAVRNLAADTTVVDLDYFDAEANLQRTDTVVLAPRQAETVNIRDVPGLAVDADGFARGFVQAVSAGDSSGRPVLAGDYIQVDVGDNFATGERVVRVTDLCDRASIRFLDFGAGTRLAVWIATPRGGLPGIDLPSFTVQAFNEAGNAVTGVIEQHAGENLLELEAADFTAVPFGSLVFDFTNSFGGTVFAEYSAEGRFSVGVDSQCEDE